MKDTSIYLSLFLAIGIFIGAVTGSSVTSYQHQTDVNYVNYLTENHTHADQKCY